MDFGSGQGYLCGASSEEPTCKGDVKCRFDLWAGKAPWRRKQQPTAVFLPGGSHGWRSLAGRSPWGRTEKDATEASKYPANMDGEWTFSHRDISYLLDRSSIKIRKPPDNKTSQKAFHNQD